MYEYDVLVFGSKPGSIAPNIMPKKVYAANAAILRAKKYIETEIVSIVGGSELQKNHVHEAILEINPSRIIVRGKKFDLECITKIDTDIVKVNWIEQYKFQTKFFNPLSIWHSEIKNKTKYKLRSLYGYMKYIFRNKRPQGLSNGLYAILLAIDENPNARIVVSGIGLSGGGHFYGIGKMTGYRGQIDRELFSMLEDKFKSRIVTVDEDFAKYGNVDLLDLDYVCNA